MDKLSENLEPDLWDYDKEGLYCGWYKPKKYEKNCIDKALKKIYGKRWNAPWWRHKKDKLIKDKSSLSGDGL